MKDKLTKEITSGKGEDKTKYNVVVLCNGMTPEQAQEDAFHYYVWKLQRVIRDATPSERDKMSRDGITVHYTEVGKKVESPEAMVDKMSDDAALKAYELLKAKFAKKSK